MILINLRGSSILSLSFPTFFATTASALSLLPEALLRFLQPLRGLVEVRLGLQQLWQLLGHDDGVAFPQLRLAKPPGPGFHNGEMMMWEMGMDRQKISNVYKMIQNVIWKIADLRMYDVCVCVISLCVCAPIITYHLSFHHIPHHLILSNPILPCLSV